MQTLSTAFVIVGSILGFSITIVLINYFYSKYISTDVSQQRKLFDFEITAHAVRTVQQQQYNERTQQLSKQIDVLRSALKVKRQQYKQAMKLAGSTDSTKSLRSRTAQSHSTRYSSKHSTSHNNDIHEFSRSNSQHRIEQTDTHRRRRRHDFEQRREALQAIRHTNHSRSINSMSVQNSQHHMSHSEHSDIHSEHNISHSDTKYSMTHNNIHEPSISLPSRHSRHNSRNHIDLNIDTLTKHKHKQKHHVAIELPSSIHNSDSDTLGSIIRQKTNAIKSTYKQPKHKLYKHGTRHKSNTKLTDTLLNSISSQQRIVALINDNGFEPAISHRQHTVQPTDTDNKSIFDNIPMLQHAINNNKVVQFDDIADINQTHNKQHIVTTEQPCVKLNTYFVDHTTSTDSTQHSTQKTQNNIKIVPYTPMLKPQLPATHVAG